MVHNSQLEIDCGCWWLDGKVVFVVGVEDGITLLLLLLTMRSIGGFVVMELREERASDARDTMGQDTNNKPRLPWTRLACRSREWACEVGS